MAFLKKENNAQSLLVSGINETDLSLTIVNAGDFPISGDFLITIWNKVSFLDPSDDPTMEILKVIAVSGDVFTVERAQESTVASVHTANDAVEMLITKGHFEEIENAIDTHIADTNNPHQVEADQIATTESGKTVQDKIDDLDVDISSHLLDLSNPHQVEADQIATTESGKTVQDKIDDLETEVGNIPTDKIEEGNTYAEVVDTGSDGHFKVVTEGTERLRVLANGNVGIGTSNPSSKLSVCVNNVGQNTNKDGVLFCNDTLADELAPVQSSPFLILDGSALSPKSSLLEIYGNLAFFKDFSSMSVGELNPSLLNADFSEGSNVATFNVNRSSLNPATYVDSNGLVIKSEANTARIQGGFYTSTGFITQKGLMVEGEATNNLLESGQIGKSPWVNTSAGSVLNSALAPDGTNTATLINVTGFWYLYQSTTLPLDTYVFSVWLKKIPGISTTISISINGSSYSSTLSVSETEWRRFFISATLENPNCRIRNTANPPGGFLAWGAQLEKGVYPTSYIPTTTTALTRNKESLSYISLNNRTNQKETGFIKYVPFGASTNEIVSRAILDSDADRVSILLNTTSKKFEYFPNLTDSNTVKSEKTTNEVAGESSILTVVSNGGSENPSTVLYKNGTVLSTTTDPYTEPVIGTNFYLGCNNSEENQLNGAIQQVAFYSDNKNSTDVSLINADLNSETEGKIYKWAVGNIPNSSGSTKLSFNYKIGISNWEEAFRFDSIDGMYLSRDLNVNGRIGINNLTPTAKLDVLSTTEQLRLGYDASNYFSTTIASDGSITFDAVGSGASFNFSDNVGIGTTTPSSKLDVSGAITQRPLSADPSDPSDGNSVQWVSDGTGSGDAGDVMMKINIGGTVKTVTLIDFSEV